MLALDNLVESVRKEMLIGGNIFLEDSLTNISKVFSKAFLAPRIKSKVGVTQKN